MDPDADAGSDRSTRASSVNLGPALRRAWLGYQRRLDAAMAEAGFGERAFPDGRVLRLCSPPSGSTISAIGRELGITRQGASKVVTRLRAGDYVVVWDSPTSAREKSVVLTSRGADYLRTQRTAARAIEAELVAELGEAAFTGLLVLLDALDALDSGENPRLRTYLQGSQPHAEPTAPIATRATQENPRSP